MRTNALGTLLVALAGPISFVLFEATALSNDTIQNSVGMKLVRIAPGRFVMGSPESEAGREAQEVPHEVELTKAFYLGAHEVTVSQFQQFVAATKYQTDGERDGKGAYGINADGKIGEMQARFNWKSPGFDQTDNHPVVNVSWRDAKAFCKWLSDKEQKPYRLPTEAEWEYACRAGTTTAYQHGDDPEGLATTGNGADATARAKYPGWSIGIQARDGHVFTAPVGQFKANAFGLCDMHGNVWEWCEDWYVPNSHSSTKQVDPTGPDTGTAKVQRGGGWTSDFKRLRSAARVGRDSVAYRGCYQGFRVVLQPTTELTTQSGHRDDIPRTPLRIQTQPRAGARVAYMLLVNGAVTEAVVKSANIAGHQSVNPPYVGTWHSFVKGMDQIQPGRLDPVERGEIDVLLIGTLMSYPNAETWKNHLGPDDSTLAGLAAVGVKNNSKFRIVWQTYVWPVGQMPKDGKKTLDVAAMKKRAASEPLKELEQLVDAINTKHGRQVVLISPVGLATIKLVEMVAAGKFPGITDPADLWTEFNMHSNRHMLALTAYCNVATMYGISPVGLNPDFSMVTYGGGGKGPGLQSMEGITDEQRSILQTIAWETVSQYSPAGVARAAEPNPRAVTARDTKLDKELEYLVFDLGKGVEFKLVKVKANGQTFRIGSSKQEQEAVNAKYFSGKQQGKLAMEDEQAITLTDDFYLGQCEVTRGQFRRFVEETGYRTIPELTDGGKGWDAKEQKFVGADQRFSWRDTGLDFQSDEYPVVNVAIDDAREFCKWLLKKCDGQIKVREVRLPGEAEWEFACRAGSQTRFHFGDDDERLVEFANVADAAAREKKLAPVTLNGSDGFPFSAPVRQFKPNGFGLYDMHGNVWEFCEDYYGKYSALPKERNALQTMKQGEIRPVMRGGAWHLTGADCRCANRYIVGSTGRYATGGFRVLCLP